MNYKKFDNVSLEHIKCSKDFDLIATFGLRTCLILNRDLETLQRYLDSNKNENFYCCDFYTDQISKKILLCIAGESGIIKILDIEEGCLHGFLKGHMGAIKYIKVFDKYLLSCGEDGCIRLWCLIQMECIGVFGGIFGHKDHICSLDITYNNEAMVTTGTDCTIKQWDLQSLIDRYLVDKKYIFNYSPFLTFSEIHKSPITMIKYYGNMIVSLSNNVISVIYNNIKKNEVQRNFNLRRNDPILIGNIELYDSCKTFIIVDHILLSLSNTGRIFVFDLRTVVNEKTPFIMDTNVKAIEDFSFADDFIYVSTSDSVHKIAFDISRFS